MFKNAVAVIVAVAGILLAPGIAHADSISDAINTHSGTPGMVTYLNTVRNLGAISTLEEVDGAAQWGDFYCHPSAQTLKDFGGMSVAQFRNFVYDNIITFGWPDIAVAWRSALDTYCAA